MNLNEQHGKFNGPAEVRIMRTLPGPIERVWEYLTDSEKRSRWFAGGAMEQRVGGKARFEFRHRNLAPDETPPEGMEGCHGGEHAMDGIILRCEPPHVLVFTFGSDAESEVTIELTAQGKNVLLVLTHRATTGDVPYMADFGAGWHTHLTHLIALLEGAPRPPFWPLHKKLKEDYQKLRLAAQG